MQVIILRGLPGSGKSSYAQKQQAVVCSADNYFIVGGEYRFDRTKLRQAHGECFKLFIESLQKQKPLIIVDNTNTSSLEIAPYIQGCGAYKYDYKIIYFECDINTSCVRNTHGVAQSTIERMYNSLKKELPNNWKKQEIFSSND